MQITRVPRAKAATIMSPITRVRSGGMTVSSRYNSAEADLATAKVEAIQFIQRIFPQAPPAIITFCCGNCAATVSAKFRLLRSTCRGTLAIQSDTELCW